MSQIMWQRMGPSLITSSSAEICFCFTDSRQKHAVAVSSLTASSAGFKGSFLMARRLVKRRASPQLHASGVCFPKAQQPPQSPSSASVKYAHRQGIRAEMTRGLCSKHFGWWWTLLALHPTHRTRLEELPAELLSQHHVRAAPRLVHGAVINPPRHGVLFVDLAGGEHLPRSCSNSEGLEGTRLPAAPAPEPLRDCPRCSPCPRDGGTAFLQASHPPTWQRLGRIAL
nr:uncharacterized protein LOC106032700 isoform X1 [Anser cygnoides]